MMRRVRRPRSNQSVRKPLVHFGVAAACISLPHNNVTPAFQRLIRAATSDLIRNSLNSKSPRLSTGERRPQTRRTFQSSFTACLQIENIQQIYMFQFPDIDSFT
jgi:hypothetical protein